MGKWNNNNTWYFLLFITKFFVSTCEVFFWNETVVHMRDQCDKIMKEIQFSAKSNECAGACSITKCLVHISKSTPSDIAALLQTHQLSSPLPCLGSAGLLSPLSPPCYGMFWILCFEFGDHNIWWKWDNRKQVYIWQPFEARIIETWRPKTVRSQVCISNTKTPSL